ncbi:MAG: hypothetical protein WBL61_09190 [Bryobacteraceae bacterium]
MSNVRTGDGETDGFASLDEICQLLQAHPGFRELPAARGARKRPAGLAIGRCIKDVRLWSFGAEFAGSLTLWHFQIHQDQPRVLAMDLRWHVEKLLDDWCVFVHFLDDGGEIRFQGDYPLKGAIPDPLGFVYSHRLVAVPAEVPRGNYSVRLGVWSPAAAAHLQLTQFRGCHRESADWCGNAVILATVTV